MLSKWHFRLMLYITTAILLLSSQKTLGLCMVGTKKVIALAGCALRPVQQRQSIPTTSKTCKLNMRPAEGHRVALSGHGAMYRCVLLATTSKPVHVMCFFSRFMRALRRLGQ